MTSTSHDHPCDRLGVGDCDRHDDFGHHDQTFRHGLTFQNALSYPRLYWPTNRSNLLSQRFVLARQSEPDACLQFGACAQAQRRLLVVRLNDLLLGALAILANSLTNPSKPLKRTDKHWLVNRG
jgi:hypothetical protein